MWTAKSVSHALFWARYVFAHRGSTFLSLLVFAATGCAVHYSNKKTGTEHLWGLGQFRIATNQPGSNWVSVATGTRAFGLCLDVGKDHYGLSLGYVERQQLSVVGKSAAEHVELPVATPRFLSVSGTTGVWAFGHLRMRGVSALDQHYAVASGRALAGLGAGFGGSDTSIGLVMDGRQTTAVLGDDVYVEFDQDAPRWPGFDLFGTGATAVKTIYQIDQERE